MRQLERSIEVSVATHKSRFKSFLSSFGSIFNDTDSFVININGLDDECLEFTEKVESMFGGSNLRIVCYDINMDYGDRAKFKPLCWYKDSSYPDYFLTIDDDLIYPRDYIKRLVDTSQKYGGIPVGVHSFSMYRKPTPLKNYFKERIVTHFAFASSRKFTNGLGTGTLCFSPKTVPIQFDFFEQPNMTDCYFAVYCQKNKIPMICVDRSPGWIIELVDNSPSLWSLRGNGEKQTEVINQCVDWAIFNREQVKE